MLTRTLCRLALLLALPLAGCPKAPPPDEPRLPPPAAEEDLARPRPPVPDEAPAPDALGRVHFALDSSRLDDEARAILRRSADILQRHPAARVEIQGHCDERGTTDYNIALGERRAQAVKQFLVAQGVGGSRLTTVSFGEEKPASFGHDEGAWAANRRAELRVVAGGDGALAGSVP